MAKAGALKKRYVLFQLEGTGMGENELGRALNKEALRFFGEYGMSFLALKLVRYSPATRKGIARCNRNHLNDILGFLALLSSLDGVSARLRTLKSSGTLKSLEEILSSNHRM